MALEQSLSELSLQVDEPSNIIAYAIKILNTAHPTQKVELTNRAVALWYAKKLSHSALTGAEIPDAPAQSEELEVIAPHKMKLGKGGSLQSRIAILHSLASIELHAINLAWDIIARFGHVTVGKEEPLPRDFFTDFVKVAEDECRHFSMLRNRLEELGSGFGKLPVHNGLWQSATETADDFLARLAVVHMVHEARGLDVTPNTIAKFRKHDDVVSADMLDTIYQEEITHVAAGMRWFRYSVAADNLKDEPTTVFHRTVLKYFHGALKPPFNDEGRAQAGFTSDWLVHYKALARSLFHVCDPGTYRSWIAKL
eukprot:TRINITY_DN11224_c0_g1_i10.p1 TRINITY_DN11224_c0_g1~~TRINITY_DN11224_c0_g1_i10.p1  ORF type:complete len:311 (+),score=38.63 TRINITY_DN11224_c0_g1_i10:1844-2776(+)